MNTLKELYLEAARVAEMIEGINLSMGNCVKLNGRKLPIHSLPSFSEPPDSYEFALAIVEDKAVFKGDELYYAGSKIIITDNNLFAEVNRSLWSWNPPLPKTVMVELLVEEAEFMVSAYGVEAKFKSATSEVAEACRKALDNLKGK